MSKFRLADTSVIRVVAAPKFTLGVREAQAPIGHASSARFDRFAWCAERQVAQETLTGQFEVIFVAHFSECARCDVPSVLSRVAESI